MRVVEPWNQLPDSIKQAESKEGFEEIVTAFNSPAGRLTDDKYSGENVKTNARWKATVTNIQEQIPANHNDAWTCPQPLYMEDWTQRAK